MAGGTWQGLAIISDTGDGASRRTFDLAHEIADSERFRRFENSIGVVAGLLESLEYQIVERNFDRLDSVQAFYENSVAKNWKSQFFNARSSLVNISFDTINWLTATRLFLDHHLTLFADRYGTDIGEHARLKAAITVQYEASRAYRVLYKLRDYAQHCGFPMHAVTLGLSEAGNPESTQVAKFYADRYKLLNSGFDWKSRVRADLGKLPDKIDVVELVRQAMPCFRAVYAHVLSVRFREAQAEVRPVVELSEMEEGPDRGEQALVRAEYSEDGRLAMHSIQRVPLEVARWIAARSGPEELIQRLAAGAVSGEADRLAGYPNVAPAVRQATKIGAALLDVYFENGGPGHAFTSAVNREIQSSRSLAPVVDGLTSIAAISLSMTGSAIGTSARDVVGEILRADENASR
jgi:hypothetical protein